MKAVWKYEMPTGQGFLKIPRGATFLSVHIQPGLSVFSATEMPCVWALVDPGETWETREVRFYGTGQHSISDNQDYIGTIHMAGGTFVLHAFAVRPAEK